MANKSVLGVEEFSRALQRVLKSVDDDALEAALFEAGLPILERAEQNAPERSGNLKGSGYVLTRKKDNYQAGPGRRGKAKAVPRTAIIAFSAFHAHLVEFDVAPHQVGGRAHPGAPAQPFLRPAYDGKRKEAEKIVEDRLRTRIVKAARGRGSQSLGD